MKEKTCGTCIYLRGIAPMMCGLPLDQINDAPRLCNPLRAPGGKCGPEGAFWRSESDALPMSATILPFPKMQRITP